MAKRQSTLRRVRWIATALLLIVLSMFAYREGFRRGYEPDGSAAAQASSSLIIVTYPVADLIASTPSPALQKPTSNYDPLIDLIVSTIEPDSWMENGAGEGEIQPFPSNGSLVIAQTRRVHQQISDLLNQLRRLGGEIDAKQAIALFQSWAALGRGHSHEFQTLPATAEGKQAAHRYFSKSLQNVAAIWGTPTFHGELGDEGFPSWSTAGEIAWWPRGAGFAYMSVSFDAESRPRITLGWRPDDSPNATTRDNESP